MSRIRQLRRLVGGGDGAVFGAGDVSPGERAEAVPGHVPGDAPLDRHAAAIPETAGARPAEMSRGSSRRPAMPVLAAPVRREIVAADDLGGQAGPAPSAGRRRGDR
ncbi:MAG TPA: hypothetical protein VFV66_27320 [Nonomuraea sp.]|nr:hypothetical protein [Nonomuraea sp.]